LCVKTPTIKGVLTHNGSERSLDVHMLLLGLERSGWELGEGASGLRATGRGGRRYPGAEMAGPFGKKRNFCATDDGAVSSLKSARRGNDLRA
jgi:hypothetical protein